MTTPPGDPFQYSEDTVAARVSVDVPNESVTNLNQLVAKAQELRTHVEASARAQQSFDEYLRQLPQLLEQANQASGRLEQSIQQPGGNVEGTAADPFSSQYREAGPRGAAETSREGATAPRRVSARERGQEMQQERQSSSAPRSAGEIEEDLRVLEREDPRQAANMRAEREGRRDSSPEPASSRPEAPPRPGRGRPPNRPDSSDNSTPPAPEQSHPDRPSQPQHDWVQELQSRAGQGQGFLNQLLNETRAGNSSPLGGAAFGARSVQQGAERLSQFAQSRVDAQTAAHNEQALAQHIAEGGTEEGFTPPGLPPGGAGMMGRLPGMLGTVGKVAGVAGVAVTAAMATQQVGEQYQQYKNQGMVRGGGFAEGIGYEGQIRALALNPFINTEQARQVINSALSEGYTGKEFETVTDFMAENLKNMNMSVADSVKLVNQQVVSGGQSVLGLTNQLSTMKGLADEGYNTFADRKATYERVAGAVVQTGATGETGGDIGMIAGTLYENDKVMKGQGEAVANALLTPMGGNAIKRNLGLDPATLPANALAVAEAEGFTPEETFTAGMQGLETLLKPIAQQWDKAKKAGNASLADRLETNAITISARYGVTPAPTKQQIRITLQQVLGGTYASQVGDAQREITEQEQKIEDTGKPTGVNKAVEDFVGINNIGDTAKNSVNELQTAVSAVNDTVGVVSDFLGITDSGKGYEDTEKANREAGAEKENLAARYKNDRVQNLVKEYGAGKVKVKDEQGKESILDQNNRQQLQQIVEGKAQIKPNDETEWTTLADLEAGKEEEQFGGGGEGGNIQIGLTPAAQQLVTAMNIGGGRTNNQQNADTGQSNGQNNKTSASEGKPWPTGGGGN